jgi:hypothetical protein
MTAVELVELAVKMRAAQRDYFKTPSKEALVASKQLERRFDEAAADFFAKEDKPT